MPDSLIGSGAALKIVNKLPTFMEATHSYGLSCIP